MKVKYLIIGSGPCGLGAGYRFKEIHEEDFLILEKTSYVGGLATSFQDDNGFTWDIGGHVQFSHYDYFDKAMERSIGKDQWLCHQRESWVWMLDRFIPYPFQNNIHRLPIKEKLNSMLGLIQNKFSPSQEPPQNFSDWIQQSFGTGISNIFLLPYNYKVWAFKPEKMNYKWIGERVSTVDLARIAKNLILNKDDVSWGPNNTFQFPNKGGTGAIWKGIADIVGREKIRQNANIVEVDPDNKKVILSSGEEIEYEYILSTIPLNELTNRISKIENNLKQKANQLLYSSSHIFGIGIKGKPHKDLKTKCWMYFPESNCPFYRVTVFSNYSPNNVPDIKTQFSLMAEVSSSPDKVVDEENLLQEVIQGLINTKLISETDEIASTWSFKADYGYPTPSLNRDQVLEAVIPELDKENIYSRGRFGGWKYEVSNQDHTFMQGVEWVDKILHNVEEKTYTL
jgi:protoporphyrinogen oxidase